MIETYIVDAFTDRPFNGNPAGVCILSQPLGDSNMLSIANELGLSETAFVQKYAMEDKYSIRYFSPKVEVPLCGHATLASSKVLFEQDGARDKIHFVTGQGLHLTIHREGEKIVMEFPAYTTNPAEAPPKLLKALGIKNIVNSQLNLDAKVLLVEIDSSKILRDLTPDFQALDRSHTGINGVVVTSRSSDSRFDFESRYFCPWIGINEDPVTGVTHTFLAGYWSNRLGKSRMNALQSSTRTGHMEVELISNNRCTLTSTAQIILQGKINMS